MLPPSLLGRQWPVWIRPHLVDLLVAGWPGVVGGTVWCLWVSTPVNVTEVPPPLVWCMSPCGWEREREGERAEREGEGEEERGRENS